MITCFTHRLTFLVSHHGHIIVPHVHLYDYYILLFNHVLFDIAIVFGYFRPFLSMAWAPLLQLQLYGVACALFKW